MKILLNDVLISDTDSQKAYDPEEISPAVLKTVSVSIPCLPRQTLPSLPINTPTFPSQSEYFNVYRSNSSNYRNESLTYCLSNVFSSSSIRKILRHLSVHNLLSDRQYGFRKGRSTGDLLSFLN